MAILEELVEEALGPVALGVGALVLVPKLFPAVGRALRPLAKEVVKAGIGVYDRTYTTVTEAYANVAEATGDLVAEARSEREAASSKAAHVKESPATVA